MQTLSDLLLDVQVLVIDANVARKFGEVRAGQLDKGSISPELDLLNASTALANNLTMVTHNTQDYDNIPGHDGC
jgi:predicted nucleic acid-binding protein